MNPELELEQLNTFLINANDHLAQLSDQITKLSKWPNTPFRQEQLDRLAQERNSLFLKSSEAFRRMQEMLLEQEMGDSPTRTPARSNVVVNFQDFLRQFQEADAPSVDREYFDEHDGQFALRQFGTAA